MYQIPSNVNCNSHGKCHNSDHEPMVSFAASHFFFFSVAEMTHQAPDSEAHERSSAALLARLDAALVAEAGGVAMGEELLTLEMQLKETAHALSSVRGMTAALSRVEQLKAERLQKEIGEAVLRDIEGLCSVLASRLNRLVAALPLYESVDGGAGAVEAQELSESEPEPSGAGAGNGSPAVNAVGGTASGEIPTEESADSDTEDEEESLISGSVKEEATSVETLSQRPAEEMESPSSGTTVVHEVESQSRKNVDGSATGGTRRLDVAGDTVTIHEAPPHIQMTEPHAEEPEMMTLCTSQKPEKGNDVSTAEGYVQENAPKAEEREMTSLCPTPNKVEESDISADKGPDLLAPGTDTGGSHSHTTTARMKITVKIDTTNIRTLARTCLECMTEIDRIVAYNNSPTLCGIAAYIALLLTSVQRMHEKRQLSGLPLLDGDVITESVEATQLLIDVIEYMRLDLTLIPLYVCIEKPLKEATHPRLTALRERLLALSIPTAIPRFLIHPRFWSEFSSPSRHQLLWDALVFLTARSPAPITKWIDLFVVEFSRPNGLQFPLPLLLLVLAIVVCKTNESGNLTDAVALVKALNESTAVYRSRNDLIIWYASQVQVTKKRSEQQQLDLTKEFEFIHEELPWIRERRLSRKRARDD